MGIGLLVLSLMKSGMGLFAYLGQELLLFKIV